MLLSYKNTFFIKFKLQSQILTSQVQNEAYTMLIQTQYIRFLESILHSTYMGRKRPRISKNPILGLDFLKTYTTELLEILFLKRHQWTLRVPKISDFILQDCRKQNSAKTAYIRCVFLKFLKETSGIRKIVFSNFDLKLRVHRGHN